MRVWWRGPADNRVDVVTAAGETDTHAGPGRQLDLGVRDGDRHPQRRRARWSCPPRPTCCRARSGAGCCRRRATGELSRIGARRVAGRDALGLRLTPAAAAASVRRVDVWVDAGTGLPLQVEVSEKGGRKPALDTRFLDLDLAVPAASVTAFPRPPAPPSGRGGRPRWCSRPDGGSARCSFPTSWPGCPAAASRACRRASGSTAAGSTLLAVAPVPERLADGLRDALSASPDAVVDELGDAGRRRAGGADGRRPAGPAGRTCSPARSRSTRSPGAAADAARPGGGAVTAVISTRGLVKQYGRLRAVDGIDLDVQRRRRLRLPRRQRVRQDDDRADAARARAADRTARSSCSGSGCLAPAAGCCPGSAR